MIRSIYRRRRVHEATVLFLVMLFVMPIRGGQQNNRQPDEATKQFKEVEKLAEQGRYDEALPLAEQVLAMREQTLGPEHISIASVLNTLCYIYRVLGQYKKAEEAGLRSLAMRFQLIAWLWPPLRMNVNIACSANLASAVSSATLGLNTSRSRPCHSMNLIADTMHSGVTSASLLQDAVSSATFIKLYLSLPESSAAVSHVSYICCASSLIRLTVGASTSLGKS